MACSGETKGTWGSPASQAPTNTGSNSMVCRQTCMAARMITAGRIARQPMIGKTASSAQPLAQPMEDLISLPVPRFSIRWPASSENSITIMPMIHTHSGQGRRGKRWRPLRCSQAARITSDHASTGAST